MANYYTIFMRSILKSCNNFWAYKHWLSCHALNDRIINRAYSISNKIEMLSSIIKEKRFIQTGPEHDQKIKVSYSNMTHNPWHLLLLDLFLNPRIIISSLWPIPWRVKLLFCSWMDLKNILTQVKNKWLLPYKLTIQRWEYEAIGLVVHFSWKERWSKIWIWWTHGQWLTGGQDLERFTLNNIDTFIQGNLKKCRDST